MKYTSFSLAFMVGLASGACDPDPEPFADECRTVGGQLAVCRNRSQDEGSTYLQDCIARGKLVRDGDENCGTLWSDAYACVAALSCEGFEDWRTSAHDIYVDFPCKDEEMAFLAECPDLPLWSDGD